MGFGATGASGSHPDERLCELQPIPFCLEHIVHHRAWLKAARYKAFSLFIRSDSLQTKGVKGKVPDLLTLCGFNKALVM